MDFVTKSVDAAVKPVESDNPNGEFEVILSTEALDRDGERLYVDEWMQPLPKRIQIDGDHSRSIEKTVGSVVPRIEGNMLIGKGSYAPTPYAQTIRQIASDKYADGHAISLSVTFAEHKNQKDGGIQRELLNAGFVAIPANAECVVLSSKSANATGMVEKFKSAIETVLKAEGGFTAGGDTPKIDPGQMVQAIHDAAYQLGSQCFNEVAADSGASDGANKGPTGTVKDGLITDKSSSSKAAGTPQESPDDSPAEAATKAAANAPAEVPAEAAEKSADDAETKGKDAAAAARALAFLMKQNAPEK